MTGYNTCLISENADTCSFCHRTDGPDVLTGSTCSDEDECTKVDEIYK